MNMKRSAHATEELTQLQQQRQSLHERYVNAKKRHDQLEREQQEARARADASFKGSRFSLKGIFEGLLKLFGFGRKSSAQAQSASATNTEPQAAAQRAPEAEESQRPPSPQAVPEAPKNFAAKDPVLAQHLDRLSAEIEKLKVELAEIMHQLQQVDRQIDALRKVVPVSPAGGRVPRLPAPEVITVGIPENSPGEEPATRERMHLEALREYRTRLHSDEKFREAELADFDPTAVGDQVSKLESIIIDTAVWQIEERQQARIDIDYLHARQAAFHKFYEVVENGSAAPRVAAGAPSKPGKGSRRGR